MPILALDYGQKRIGVAVSDPTGTLARPLPFLDAEPFSRVVAKLQELIRTESVEFILVGMPRNMDGSYGQSAQNVRSFVAQLQRSLTVPIETRDERLSTVQASRMLHDAGHDTRAQKTKIDSASAAVLLQSHLDRAAFQKGPPEPGDGFGEIEP